MIDFKTAWHRQRSRFAALARRERGLLLAALVALPLLLGWQFTIEPALKQRSVLARQLAADENALAELQQQLQTLAARRQDPDAALQSQLAAVRAQARDADARFVQLEQSLVPAPAVGAWLAGVLQAQRGLQLTGLQSLPAMPVGEAKTDNAVAKPAAAASTPASDAALYRHGVQITVQGSYADLLACLRALEALPQRVYWGPLTLDAQQHPVLVLTLTVYTLSLQKDWWAI